MLYISSSGLISIANHPIPSEHKPPTFESLIVFQGAIPICPMNLTLLPLIRLQAPLSDSNSDPIVRIFRDKLRDIVSRNIALITGNGKRTMLHANIIASILFSLGGNVNRLAKGLKIKSSGMLKNLDMKNRLLFSCSSE